VIGRRSQRAGLRDIWLVWLLYGLATVAVFETYWRIPPAELWKVHNSGFVGGIGRALVFVGFSPAVAALAVLPVVADQLEDRRTDLLAVVAAAFCATVAFVQTPSHLDPKWSNVLPVIGVALAVALTARASSRGRPERVRTTRAGDRARLALWLVVLLWATPYIAAELGFHLDGVPFFGWFFQTGKLAPEPGSGELHATVHYGHHHGLDGFLLATTALLVSRLLGGMRRLRTLTAAILSLMLVYALTNMVNDLWTEQVVKRGWTHWEVPDVLQPSASFAWLAMLLAAAVIYAAFFARTPLFGRR
jgi:hypothetical protein